MKTINGGRVDSLSVLTEFQGQVLLDKIRVDCMSFPVRPYVPPPLQCYKCQRYGHIAKVCNGKQRCAKYRGENKFEDCGENTQAKCCNCVL